MEHDLRFHKSGSDKSAKCDAYFTSKTTDVIHGILFDIDPIEKPALDKVEGLGFGYDEKLITITNDAGHTATAITYFATRIDVNLKPYSWYLNHVLIGARESLLPLDYIELKIASIEAIDDSDRLRDAKERAIHY
jgi:hypothetical protein